MTTFCLLKHVFKIFHALLKILSFDKFMWPWFPDKGLRANMSFSGQFFDKTSSDMLTKICLTNPSCALGHHLHTPVVFTLLLFPNLFPCLQPLLNTHTGTNSLHFAINCQHTAKIDYLSNWKQKDVQLFNTLRRKVVLIVTNIKIWRFWY